MVTPSTAAKSHSNPSAQGEMSHLSPDIYWLHQTTYRPQYYSPDRHITTPSDGEAFSPSAPVQTWELCQKSCVQKRTGKNKDAPLVAALGGHSVCACGRKERQPPLPPFSPLYSPILEFCP